MALINGTAEDDTLIGDQTAPGSRDTINGLGGNDVLDGRGGNDTLDGGDGDDRLIAGIGFDRLDGGDGLDTLDLSAATSGWNVSLLIEDGHDTAGNRVVAVDMEGIIGSAFDDALEGRGGTVLGGDGNDFINAFGGRNGATDGGPGIDTLKLDDLGFSGNLLVFNMTTGHLSSGGSPGFVNFENVISGFSSDYIYGTDGANRIVTFDGGDQVYAGGGRDTIEGGNGVDYLYGEAGRDRVKGGADNDVLDGGAGDDRLIGGTGDDFIAGNVGYDTIAGGAGADMFIFTADADSDVIVDFSRAEQDKIRIDAEGVTRFGQLTIASDGHGGSLVTFGSVSIDVAGVDPDALGSRDFRFGPAFQSGPAAAADSFQPVHHSVFGSDAGGGAVAFHFAAIDLDVPITAHLA